MATLPQTQKSQQEIFTQRLDTKYIITHIPIEIVWENLADENPGLGMEPIKHHATRCPWHSDQIPSLHFSKNNKYKCHVCDVGLPYSSNLDLVKKVLHCDVPCALRWFQAHWDIPLARAGRPSGSHGTPKPYRVGFGGPLEAIIRSGLFGELSAPARLLLSVLVAVQDERKECDWSYESLMQATGLRSRNAIRAGTEELRRARAISIRKFTKPGEIKVRNAYKLTLDHPDLAKRIDLAHGAHFFANEQARQLAAISRKFRFHSKKNQPEP